MLALPQVLPSTSFEGLMHSQDHTLQKSFARSCPSLCMHQIRAAPYKASHHQDVTTEATILVNTFRILS